MALRPATRADVELLAALHRPAFPEEPWSAEALATLLESPGVYGLIAEGDGPPPGRAGGFILCRAVADEAEVLTLAVLPALRRRGAGSLLLAGGLAWAAAGGVTRMVLEVAEDNRPALALYGGAGFTAVGRRPAYYRRAGAAVAAIILARSLDGMTGGISPWRR